MTLFDLSDWSRRPPEPAGFKEIGISILAAGEYTPHFQTTQAGGEK